jgi:hypothetical protein
MRLRSRDAGDAVVAMYSHTSGNPSRGEMEKRGGAAVSCKTVGAYPHVGVDVLVDAALGRRGRAAETPSSLTWHCRRRS